MFSAWKRLQQIMRFEDSSLSVHDLVAWLNSFSFSSVNHKYSPFLYTPPKKNVWMGVKIQRKRRFNYYSINRLPPPPDHHQFRVSKVASYYMLCGYPWKSDLSFGSVSFQSWSHLVGWLGKSSIRPPRHLCVHGGLFMYISAVIINVKSHNNRTITIHISIHSP